MFCRKKSGSFLENQTLAKCTPETQTQILTISKPKPSVHFFVNKLFSPNTSTTPVTENRCTSIFLTVSFILLSHFFSYSLCYQTFRHKEWCENATSPRRLHCDTCGGIIRGILTPTRPCADEDDAVFIRFPSVDEEKASDLTRDNEVGKQLRR